MGNKIFIKLKQYRKYKKLIIFILIIILPLYYFLGIKCFLGLKNYNFKNSLDNMTTSIYYYKEKNSGDIIKINTTKYYFNYPGGSYFYPIIFSRNNNEVRSKLIMFFLTSNEYLYLKYDSAIGSEEDWKNMMIYWGIAPTFKFLPLKTLSKRYWYSEGAIYRNTFKEKIDGKEYIKIDDDKLIYTIKIKLKRNIKDSKWISEWWSPYSGLVAFTMPDGKMYIRSKKLEEEEKMKNRD